MNKFKIKFQGLEEGKYSYNFEIKDDFFEDFEKSEIQKGKVSVLVDMFLNKDIIILNIFLKGSVLVQCDRCLEDYYQSLEYKTKLFVETGFENSDISDVDNKIVLSKKEEYIVLDKHFYDYLHLSLPYQKFHPKDKDGNLTCAPKMIKKLDELSSGNNKKELDPRWDKLKDIFK